MKCVHSLSKTLLLLFALISPTLSLAAEEGCEKPLLSPAVPEMGTNTERVIQTYLKAHLPETQALFQKIVTDYPMQSYEYVLVGRSPTLLAAIFEIQKNTFSQLRAWNLPISIKNKNEVGLYELMDRFEQLFDGYQQKPVDPKRKIVFIDTVADGRTFKVIDNMLSLMDKSAEFVGFADDSRRAESVLGHWRLRSSYRVYPVSSAYSYELGLLKNLAPYEPHAMDSANYPMDPVIPGPVRPLFHQLLKGLMQTGEF